MVEGPGEGGEGPAMIMRGPLTAPGMAGERARHFASVRVVPARAIASAQSCGVHVITMMYGAAGLGMSDSPHRNSSRKIHNQFTTKAHEMAKAKTATCTDSTNPRYRLIRI